MVVKVQRPGLEQLFEIDLGILGRVATFIQNKTPLGGDQRDWISIYGECRRTLMQEVDYCNEGRNADTFRRKFRRDKTVRAPKILWRYCSPRVLTMERFHGWSVDDFIANSELQGEMFGPATIVVRGSAEKIREAVNGLDTDWMENS